MSNITPPPITKDGPEERKWRQQIFDLLAPATLKKFGTVKKAAISADAVASSAATLPDLLTDHNALVTKYNALLSALRVAGIIGS